MIILVKHGSYRITYDFFLSLQRNVCPTVYNVNTTDCTLETCVPIGLETIKATGRGQYLVQTNNESPLCGKLIQIYIQELRHEKEFTPISTLDEGSVCAYYLITCYLITYFTHTVTQF
jgi:hypothetical protein